MPSTLAVLPDQATCCHRQQHHGYPLLIHYFLQGQESEIAGGLYIHSGVLQAAHAIWSDMTQIGLVQALFYPDETASRREGEQPERSPFSKEAFHGAAAAVLKDHIIRYAHIAYSAAPVAFNLHVHFLLALCADNTSFM